MADMKNDSGYKTGPADQGEALTPASYPMAPSGYGTDWGQVYPNNGWPVPDNSASQYTGVLGHGAAVVNRAGGNDGDPLSGNTIPGLTEPGAVTPDSPGSGTPRGTGNNV